MGFGDKLRDAVDKVKNSLHVDNNLVKEVIKEIQRALISSDVNIKLVLTISKEIEEKAFEKLPTGLTRKEHLVKTFYDVLLKYIGGEQENQLPDNPKTILLCGLFGSGKTTSAAKLAKFYKKRGFKVGVICADTYRPAAYEQLKQLCEKVECLFYGEPNEKVAYKVVEKGLKDLQKKGANLIIVDSAGRSALDEKLTKEIKEIYSVFNPSFSFLVISADIGQAVKDQAEAFNKSIGVNGVIITKLDGSAKGGGALTACYITKSPIYYIGTGEKTDDFELFDANRYLSRIMGYGDLTSLLEKVKEISTQENMKELEGMDPNQLMKGNITFAVFKKQLDFTKKLGPFSKVMGFLGVGNKIDDNQKKIGETKIKKFRVILDSFTKEELNNEPSFLNRSRIKRISNGSGTKYEDVKELVSYIKKMRKMFKRMGSGGINNMARQLKANGLDNIENIDPSKMDMSQLKDLSKKIKFK
jgi:signal recognition particle subunit SRP54